MRVTKNQVLSSASGIFPYLKFKDDFKLSTTKK